MGHPSCVKPLNTSLGVSLSIVERCTGIPPTELPTSSSRETQFGKPPALGKRLASSDNRSGASARYPASSLVSPVPSSLGASICARGSGTGCVKVCASAEEVQASTPPTIPAAIPTTLRALSTRREGSPLRRRSKATRASFTVLAARVQSGRTTSTTWKIRSP